MTRAARRRTHQHAATQSQQPNSGRRVASDPSLGLFPAALTLLFARDNFQVALLDAYTGYQEWVTGIAEVVICLLYVLVKLYEFPGELSQVLTLKSLIKFPTCPDNIRIYRDTAVIVIIAYVLLLDINLSYLWLSIFPAIAIAFIYALCIELCPPGEAGELANHSGNCDDVTTKGSEQKALKGMAAVPFGVLLVMAQLNHDAADRFAISQFLLFLSTTLGALTYMMMRLPTCASPGVATASELLHKSFLLLLLVTAHTVAAEALGEEVVLICMPELVPLLMWFSLHLDGNSSIISLNKMRWPGKDVLAFLGAVVVALLAYFAKSMGESGLSRCTTILLSCCVSGLLTYYLVFMLRQWPGQQTAAGKIDDVAAADISLQPKKKGGKGKSATASSEEAVQPEEQTAASSEEAVQLLKLWAIFLLTMAGVLLILKYAVARRLGLQESQLVDTFCRNFQPLCW